MLIHDKPYLDTLRDMLKEAQMASVAVAFWGQGSEWLFKDWRGTSLRIICNLALGGTNPAAIEKLQKLKGAEVHQLDNLHAKLVLTDRQLVLGSANISTNGLGLEASEAAGFRELGMLSRDAKDLKDAGAWFDALWKTSRKIEEADLELARKAWAKRRKGRPFRKEAGTGGLLELQAAGLKEREIYFAVYHKHLSPLAKERLKAENQKLTSSANPSHDKLGLYEGWGVDELPKDPKAVIIPIYWGVRGRIDVCKAQRPVPELEDSYTNDGGERWRLDFVAYVKDPRTLDLPFSFMPADRKQLHKPISDWLKSTQDIREESAFCVPAHDFLHWWQTKGR